MPAHPALAVNPARPARDRAAAIPKEDGEQLQPEAGQGTFSPGGGGATDRRGLVAHELAKLLWKVDLPFAGQVTLERQSSSGAGRTELAIKLSWSDGS